MPHKDPEKAREYLRKYRSIPKNRINRNVGSRKKRKSNKILVLTEYSKKISNSDHPVCACCGEDFHEIFLSIDHIIPLAKTRSRILRGNDLYPKLIKQNFPDGYQVLCHNCNHAKDDLGECPHQRSNK